jgi:hypothetical protein
MIAVTGMRMTGPDQCVGAMGGGVADAVHGLEQRRELRLPVHQLRDLGQAVEQAAAQVERRGQGLCVPHVVAIDQAEVGECGTVVDVDQSCHRSAFLSGMPLPLAPAVPASRRAGIQSLAVTAW